MKQAFSPYVAGAGSYQINSSQLTPVLIKQGPRVWLCQPAGACPLGGRGRYTQ